MHGEQGRRSNESMLYSNYSGATSIFMSTRQSVDLKYWSP
jgi:hypothetical protein